MESLTIFELGYFPLGSSFFGNDQRLLLRFFLVEAQEVAVCSLPLPVLLKEDPLPPLSKLGLLLHRFCCCEEANLVAAVADDIVRVLAEAVEPLLSYDGGAVIVH